MAFAIETFAGHLASSRPAVSKRTCSSAQTVPMVFTRMEHMEEAMAR